MIKYNIVLILLMGLGNLAYGQEITKANSSWINAEFGLDWNKDLSFELSQSTRYTDILGPFANSNTTIEVAYDINKWLKVAAGYRYIYRESKQRKFNRYQFAIQARKKIDDLKLTYRLRLEEKDAIKRDADETRLRNKFTISHPFKKLKLEPKVYLEYWYSFDEEIKDFSKYRIGLSLEYEIYDNGAIEVGYRYDNDLNQFEIEQENILVLEFSHNFKRKRETKSSKKHKR